MSLRTLFARLTDIGEFLSIQKKVSSVQGYLSDLEGYALLQFAANGPGIGEIVELGSYLGRSTVFLASGAKSAAREKVTAVDHFRGSPEQQPGQPHQSEVLVQEGTTLHQFQKNIQRMKVDDYVNPIVASSEDAAGKWEQPVRLLFIDGDHSYEQSKKDFELWSRFVVKSGLICFHDIKVWPGVTQFYEELMRTPGNFQEVATIDSMKVIQRYAG